MFYVFVVFTLTISINLVTSEYLPCPVNSEPSELSEQPFADLNINILGLVFGQEALAKSIRDWEQITGAKVRMPRPAESESGLNAGTVLDLEREVSYYDGYIVGNQIMPTLAHGVHHHENNSVILELDSMVKNGEMLDWLGIHEVYRENISMYNSHIYSIPLDGDQFLLYYRRDLQERDGWEVPKTWDDLITVAELYENKDLNEDGVSDYAMCQPNTGDFSFYSLYAPLVGLLQTHPRYHPDVKDRIFPKRHSPYFNLTEDGLSPLVNNAAMRRNLKLMRRIYELGRSEKISNYASEKDILSGHELYRNGQCAFYYSFPSAGTNSIKNVTNNNETAFPYQHGRMGTSVLPGWTEYFDGESNTLKACTNTECPLSEALPINKTHSSYLTRASYFPNGGMGGIINGKISQLKQKAVFDLFSFLSRNIKTTDAGQPYNPFRSPVHFEINNYIKTGWDHIDADLYLDAIENTLANKNVVSDLRVPNILKEENDGDGFFNYYIFHFNDFYSRLDKEGLTANDPRLFDIADEVLEALDRDIGDWISRCNHKVEWSEEYWIGKVEQIYRRGMGLPLRIKPRIKPQQYVKPLKKRTNTLKWVGWLLGSIILLLAFCCSGWVYWNKKQPFVIASQPLFLHMICAGVFLMGSSLFPMSLDNSNSACICIPWLISMGFTVTFAALFSKIWRINILFNSGNFRRVVVTERDVLLPFGIIFTLNLICLVSWSIINPPAWVQTEKDGYEYGMCDWESGNSFVFSILIFVIDFGALVLALFQAYRTRSVSTDFSESKFIAIAVASWIQVSIIGMPLSVLITDDPSSTVFLWSALVFVFCMSTLLLIFVPKFMSLNAKYPVERLSIADSTAISNISTHFRGRRHSEVGDCSRVGVRMSISLPSHSQRHFVPVDDQRKLEQKLEERSEELQLLKSTIQNFEIIEAFRARIQVKDRKYNFRSYQKCFVGCEAVDLLIKLNVVTTRENAVGLGRNLRFSSKTGLLFEHVSRDHDFKDEYLFYRFTDSKVHKS